ncbi:ABC transporter substrate-binding protein [Azoarcus sp. L1K30]|uniref:helical backbone metal receptor n=1 Tax=Azoarcus sp. L1K30 TaxID=2820277 RepID=UPI001B840533|nr:helical backbone metal receptor [Azoarcus sp. L1K30]MBR0566993.1 ABC transporter substrate-binding protein [Azoarcus sp. L1K30]
MSPAKPTPSHASPAIAPLTDAVGHVHRTVTAVPRIVSLVPSLTELLCALGLVDALVGRTGFCIHPRDALRRVRKVGGTKDVKIDVVRALAPTHLIVNIDENRRETVDALAEFVPHVIVTHPCVPHDNLELYRLFGGIFAREAEAAALADRLRAALADADTAAREHTPESVLYLIWRQPWMTVSRATYISAMLRAVGWHTLPVQDAPRYPELEWSVPWLEGVDRVFLSSEPYRFTAGHVAEVESLAARPASLIDGEMASWYGNRAIEGLHYLANLRRRLARRSGD